MLFSQSYVQDELAPAFQKEPLSVWMTLLPNQLLSSTLELKKLRAISSSLNYTLYFSSISCDSTAVITSLKKLKQQTPFPRNNRLVINHATAPEVKKKRRRMALYQKSQ